MREFFGTILLFLVPIAVIAFVLWLITYFTQNFEGVASIFLLVLAIAALIWFGREVFEYKANIIIFMFIFIFLGIIFDGAGNFIYNKPIQMLCPAETSLSREVIISEDYEGNTVYSHVFSCFAEDQDKAVKHFPVYQTVGIRSAEYLLIGGFLLSIYWFVSGIFKPKKK